MGGGISALTGTQECAGTLDWTYHSQFVERACFGNILQGRAEIRQLGINLVLGSLRILDSCGFEVFDRSQSIRDVVSLRLERLEGGLNLVDDGLILEDGAVVREVDFAGGVLQNGDLAAGILVALLEGLELGRSLAL